MNEGEQAGVSGGEGAETADADGRTNRRRAAMDKARRFFNPSLSRVGRVERQVRRCFIASDGQPVTMRKLRERCYPCQRRRHWHHGEIRRALAKLGAVRIGWGLYATCPRHEK